MTAAEITALRLQVLDTFRQELAEAGPDQLVHLAQRAEAQYSSELGDRMRALVDDERARRVFAGGAA